MATSTTASKNPAQVSGLPRALVQHGWITPANAQSITERSLGQKIDVIDAIVAEKLPGIDTSSIARFGAEAFSHPLLDISALDLGMLPENLLSAEKMLALQAVPLRKRGNVLFVAMSDPTDLESINQIQFSTQSSIEVIVVEHNKLKITLEKLANASSATMDEFANMDVDLESISTLDEPAEDKGGNDADDAPVVRFLQGMLMQAVAAGASDLHFEPYEKTYRIRFRVDGILKEIAAPPAALKEKIAARLKIISRLDISEKRVPQDGRVKVNMGGNKVIDFRVSTLPTLFGEKIVMRILDPAQAKLGIDALGYDPDQKETLLAAVSRPYGMVLVTGPTGSGKTVSLYTCLNILNVPGTNISTAEDPAEINLPGINQVNVNDKAGLTFSVALKAFLRQDPDVIMVGEIRDLDTADIAIKAAQTGHMVLSTLHTNDAPSTLTRLMNMGVAPFNIASSIILITAQRLARRLCNCKQTLNLSQEILKGYGFSDEDLTPAWPIFGPGSCERCGGTGYKGRVGIYQVMPITEAMQTIILNNGSALDISKQAVSEGVNSLRRAGLLKVKQGVTSIEEVFSCTNE